MLLIKLAQHFMGKVNYYFPNGNQKNVGFSVPDQRVGEEGQGKIETLWGELSRLHTIMKEYCMKVTRHLYVYFVKYIKNSIFIKEGA